MDLLQCHAWRAELRLNRKESKTPNQNEPWSSTQCQPTASVASVKPPRMSYPTSLNFTEFLEESGSVTLHEAHVHVGLLFCRCTCLP